MAFQTRIRDRADLPECEFEYNIRGEEAICFNKSPIEHRMSRGQLFLNLKITHENKNDISDVKFVEQRKNIRNFVEQPKEIQPHGR